MNGAWAAVETALDRAAGTGRTIRVWLRDDDALDVTPGLERLERLCAAAGMPVLLAVIPAGATRDLAAWVAAHPVVTPCQHGYAHINHAGAGARACELGARDLDIVASELSIGRARLRTLFGARLSDCLVPPWNRIDPALVPRLPDLGFDALSVFGPPEAGDGVPRQNTDLDIVDWRGGRVGRSLDDVAGKLARLVDEACRQDRPIGLLTHHLAHDEAAWSVLEEILARLEGHPAVAFATLADAFDPARA